MTHTTDTPPNSSFVPGPVTLAIDVGGTGIKALPLNSAGGALGPSHRLATPKPATPNNCLEVMRQLAEMTGSFDRIAVGFPGVVRQGVTLTAPNLDPSWAGFPLAAELTTQLGKPARVANDADVQGFGVISGQGVEMVLTLGTGMGSAIFIDGILVPNLELPHHPFADGHTYEQLLGQAALNTWGEAAWRQRLDDAIVLLRRIFNYDLLYLGGGNSRMLHQDQMPADVRVAPNVAGLLGGIALWTGVSGTSLYRAPQSEGAFCELYLPYESV